MNSSMYKQQSAEIDIEEFIWKTIIQWKAVAVLAIIMALIFSGIKYCKDVFEYNAIISQQKELEEQKKIPAEERIAALLNSLPSEDATVVRQLVREKGWLKAQKEYLTESVLMSADSTELLIERLVYFIEADNSEISSGLKSCFETYVESDEFAELICASIGEDVKTKYIGELINSEGYYKTIKVVEDDANHFTISIILPDTVDLTEVKNAVDSALMAYSKELNKQYNHKFTLVTNNWSKAYNEDTANRQKDALDRATGIENNINNTEGSLTPQQKSTLDAIMAIIEESNNNNTGTEANVIAEPRVNIKYTILGMAFALIVYIGNMLIQYVVKGRTESSARAESVAEIRNLIEIYFPGEHKGITRLLHSKTIEKYHYGSKMDISMQEEKLIDTLDAIGRKTGTNDIAFINISGNPDTVKGKRIYEEVISKATKRGIIIRHIDFSEEIAEQKMIGLDSAAIILDSATKLDYLKAIISLCKDYNISTLGFAYISEV